MVAKAQSLCGNAVIHAVFGAFLLRQAGQRENKQDGDALMYAAVTNPCDISASLAPEHIQHTAWSNVKAAENINAGNQNGNKSDKRHRRMHPYPICSSVPTTIMPEMALVTLHQQRIANGSRSTPRNNRSRKRAQTQNSGYRLYGACAITKSTPRQSRPARAFPQRLRLGLRLFHRRGLRLLRRVWL